MLELTVRLVVSLSIVVGLLLVLARVGQRKFRGSAGAMVRVVHRQPLSRTSAVAVVSVGSRVLVLGTTEQQVSVLAELDPDEIELEDLDGVTDLDEDAISALELTVPTLAPVPAPTPAPVLALAPPPPPPAKASDHRYDGTTRRTPTKPAPRVPGSHRAAPPPRTVPTPGTGALAGSVLSPQTWRQAFNAVSNRSPRGTARRAS